MKIGRSRERHKQDAKTSSQTKPPSPQPQALAKPQSQRRPRQLRLLASQSDSYGGELRNRRRDRERGRPISIKRSMHVVLRSSRAKGEWSLRNSRNYHRVRALIQCVSREYGVNVISSANVGNHLHLHVRVPHRLLYMRWIRRLTGAIALAVTGVNGREAREQRQNREAPKTGDDSRPQTGLRFWDHRPYTRIVASGRRSFLKIQDFIMINRWEGFGHDRSEARWMIERGEKPPDH